MLISHKGHTDTIQVYSVTVMTHVKALQAGHSSQGTSAPITPEPCHSRWRRVDGEVYLDMNVYVNSVTLGMSRIYSIYVYAPNILTYGTFCCTRSGEKSMKMLMNWTLSTY